MYMEPNLTFELSLKLLEFEKKMPKSKLQGLKMGRTRFKPTPKEPPTFFKESKLGLKVLLKRKIAQH